MNIEGGYSATVLLHGFINLCTLILFSHTSAPARKAVLTVQIKTQTAGVTVGGIERKRNKGRERENRQGGGANKRKPQLLCVRGTHPWSALKARHYRGSQMIALVKTTG